MADRPTSPGNRPSVQVFEHTRIVTEVVYSPDGKLIASALEGETVIIWVTATGQKLLQTSVPFPSPSHLQTMVFSPDGKHLVLGFSDLVMLWSVTAGEQVRISPKQSRDYCSMALSPGGRELALGTSDGKIELWDMTTRQMIKILCDLSSDIRVSAIAYSPDGKVLASASDSTIRLWDAVIEQRASSNVSPLRNWEMQLGLREKTAKLWRGIAIRKNPAKRLNEQYWSASEVVLSPNGEQVAVKEVPNRYTITVWDVREGQPVQEASYYRRWWVDTIAFPPTKGFGSPKPWLAIGSFRLKKVFIYHTTKGKEVKVLDVNSQPGEPGGEISGLAFSFDCKQLASAI
ncbi:hypothetical protein TWF225_009426 [Orbilia oligospora]|nr:hypothetical protein TWF225_009426 [Orbilia oligospora]KAF3259411.1 hypothetical protein TWF217_005109 [Orbilia oligospora]KAF3263893.1 hypothetical protein TWF128_001529 [Orbilia oligospora]